MVTQADSSVLMRVIFVTLPKPNAPSFWFLKFYNMHKVVSVLSNIYRCARMAIYYV